MPKRLTTEQFIERARAVHGDKYDYSKSVYVDSKSKIEIVCKKCGSFWQTPNTHSSGSGCFKCGVVAGRSKLRKSRDTVIQDFRDTHGDKYDYSRVVYKNNLKKVEIGCEIHGFFWQSPNTHRAGHGCPKCGRDRRRELTLKPLDKVLQDFKKAHGDRYDYSRMVYEASYKKIEIGCKEHGFFWQTPITHASGSGCPKCSKNYAKTLEGVLAEFKKAHGDRYDYSRFVVYHKMTYTIEIGCKIHGFFRQTIFTHRNGHGCPKCGTENSKKGRLKTLEEIIEEFKKAHGDLYDYSRVTYVNCATEVEIGCKKHGFFWQKPSGHKRGKGCQTCVANKSERLFGVCLEELGYDARKIKPKWLRNPKTGYPLELDFYIPELKIAFEVQGLQHYEPVDHWGGEEAFEIRQERDQQKRNLCFMFGVTLYEYDLRLGKDKEPMVAFLKEVLPKPKKRKRKRSQ